MARVVVEKARASAVAKIVREGRRIVGGLVADCAWNYVYVHLCGWTKRPAARTTVAG